MSDDAIPLKAVVRRKYGNAGTRATAHHPHPLTALPGSSTGTLDRDRSQRPAVPGTAGAAHPFGGTPGATCGLTTSAPTTMPGPGATSGADTAGRRLRHNTYTTATPRSAVDTLTRCCLPRPAVPEAVGEIRPTGGLPVGAIGLTISAPTTIPGLGATSGAGDVGKKSRPRGRPPHAPRPRDPWQGNVSQTDVQVTGQPVALPPPVTATTGHASSTATSTTWPTASASPWMTAPTSSSGIPATAGPAPSQMATGMPLPLPPNVDWGTLLHALFYRQPCPNMGPTPTDTSMPLPLTQDPSGSWHTSTMPRAVRDETGPGTDLGSAGRPFIDFSPQIADTGTGVPHAVHQFIAPSGDTPYASIPFTSTYEPDNVPSDIASDKESTADCDRAILRKRPMMFLTERYPQFFVPAAKPSPPLADVEALLGVSQEPSASHLKEPSTLTTAITKVFEPTYDSARLSKASPFTSFFPLGSGLLPPGPLPRVSEDSSLRRAPVHLSDSGSVSLSGPEARNGEISSHGALVSAGAASSLLAVLTQLLGAHTSDEEGSVQFHIHDMLDAPAITACLQALSQALEHTITSSATNYRRFIVARRTIALSSSRLSAPAVAELIASPFSKDSLFGPSLATSCQLQADRNRDLLISATLAGSGPPRKRSAPRSARPQSGKRRFTGSSSQFTSSAPQPSFPGAWQKKQNYGSIEPPRPFRARGTRSRARGGSSHSFRGASQRSRRGTSY